MDKDKCLGFFYGYLWTITMLVIVGVIMEILGV